MDSLIQPDPDPFIVNVKTDNFTFRMEIKERLSPHSIYFSIGEKKRPCLEFSVLMPDVPTYFKDEIHTVQLGQVEALEECAENEINDDYMDKHSMGKELINIVIDTLKKPQFRHVLYIQLLDKSYIPCRREWSETLDLLTYSVALYGQTWYEKTYKAVFEPKDLFKKYRKTVEEYISPEYKMKIPFDALLKYLVTYPNEYARTLFYSNLDKYKDMYNSSNTFPNFFRSLANEIPKKDKCKLFKSWLEGFINDIIPNIPRKWIFRVNTTINGYTRKTKRRVITKVSVL